MKRTLLLTLLLAALCSITARAEDARQDAALTAEGFGTPAALFDGSRTTYSAAREGAAVRVAREGGVAALYLEFDRLPPAWELVNDATGASVSCGTQGFLHEFVDVAALFGAPVERLTLRFPAGAVLADAYAFSAGELPDWVQRWDAPCEQADLVLVSTHSDDEQLFFAGVLPYYAVERGLRVQVVYLIQHFEVNGARNHQRPHEQLDGLWTVGVRHYPLISEFPDLYAESKDRETALRQALTAFGQAGYTMDDFTAYLTACIRRFRPLVIVSHDLNGEYGHGAHVICAAALTDAFAAAADAARYDDSAAQYGVWQAEKLYLHLYGENQIVMDWDTPCDSLGGKTPFEVTQSGFACHKSQHWTWFYRWIYGTNAAPIRKASDIRSYSPCRYGLYATTVGADVTGGDFMENVETWAERERRAAKEEAARAAAEARRKAEEDAARLEAARKEAEARLAAETKARADAAAQQRAEEIARREDEAEAKALRAAQRRHTAAVVTIAAAGVAVVGVIVARVLTTRGRRERR